MIVGGAAAASASADGNDLRVSARALAGRRRLAAQVARFPGRGDSIWRRSVGDTVADEPRSRRVLPSLQPQPVQPQRHARRPDDLHRHGRIDLYDELARSRSSSHWWFQARRKIVWSLVRRFVGGGANRRLRICELGCGTGGNLASRGRQSTTWSASSVRRMRSTTPATARRSRATRAACRTKSILPAESFDVVLLTDVLEHIEDDVSSAADGTAAVAAGGNRGGDGAGLSVALFAARRPPPPFSPLRQTAVSPAVGGRRGRDRAAEPLQHAAVSTRRGRAAGEQTAAER